MFSSTRTAAALEQMGEPPTPGYGDHGRRQYEGLLDVGGLAEGLGLR